MHHDVEAVRRRGIPHDQSADSDAQVAATRRRSVNIQMLPMRPDDSERFVIHVQLRDDEPVTDKCGRSGPRGIADGAGARRAEHVWDQRAAVARLDGLYRRPEERYRAGVLVDRPDVSEVVAQDVELADIAGSPLLQRPVHCH